uniref:anaphase-promoting complex subunit 10-like isoform X1 n=1 Tax=Myxine glutinosa TaxID=7769 RepID=UPI00358F7319
MWYLHPSQRPHRRYLFSTKQLQDQHVIPKKKPIKGEKSVWFSPKINAMATKTPAGEDPKKLERTGRVREIGSQAIWSLSSCKPGFGVDQLRDDNLETYWQSDGSQPHLVNIQFRRKTAVKTVCIYADYKADESYTPSRVSLRVGNNFHDLQEIRQLDLVEPGGWVHIPLEDPGGKPLRTFMIQMAVLANHQNGRDTHLRQVRVYTPAEEMSLGNLPRFTTTDCLKYSTIR